MRKQIVDCAIRRGIFRSFSANTKVPSGAEGTGGVIVDRGEQARGAMKEYLKNVSTASAESGKGEGLWARLRKDIDNQQQQQQQQQQPAGEKREKKPFVSRDQQQQQNRGPPRPRPDGSSSNRGPQQQFNRRPPQHQSSSQQQQQVSSPGTDGGKVSSSANNNKEESRGEQKWKKPSGGNRVWNNRTNVPKKNKGDVNMGAASAAIDGGVRSKGRRSRRDNEGEDGERRENSFDQIPPTIQPLLFDHEFFAQKATHGNEIDDSKMDPLDALMAEAFMDSFKTRDGSYQTYLRSSQSSRVSIPKPRSIVQLQYSMIPPISCPPNTTAYALAESAWGVVQKNFYYNDRQKLQIISGVATNMMGLQQVLDKTDASKVDMIFEPTFRKGIPGIERENREKMLSQVVVKVDDGLDKGETDWGVAAVEDEDQL